MCDSILYISEEKVKEFLKWDLVLPAIEAALVSVTNKRVVQNPRSFTILPKSRNGLLSMPGYLQHDEYGALACKLVTSFPTNLSLEPPLPTIIGNILLFDDATGVLKAVIAATEITTYRTAAASAVATKYLQKKNPQKANGILAILGAGTQGRIHAIAFQHFFNFKEVHIWNRTKDRAEKVANELRAMLKGSIQVFDNAKDCVLDADVIVTATSTSTPILKREWLKLRVHINAIGAGMDHHKELEEAIYKEADVYVDHMDSAKSELAGLEKIGVQFKGEIGSVIAGSLMPSDKITVFQSLGIAAEDCAMARIIYDHYKEGR